MTDETKAIIAGGYINSVLFLMGVFAGALVAGSHVATTMALGSAAVAVLHYGQRLTDPYAAKPWTLWSHMASVALAVSGALVLLWGYWL